MNDDNSMTKADRDALIRIIRLESKQAKQEAVQREKVLLAEGGAPRHRNERRGEAACEAQGDPRAGHRRRRLLRPGRRRP